VVLLSIDCIRLYSVVKSDIDSNHIELSWSKELYFQCSVLVGSRRVFKHIL